MPGGRGQNGAMTVGFLPHTATALPSLSASCLPVISPSFAATWWKLIFSSELLVASLELHSQITHCPFSKSPVPYHFYLTPPTDIHFTSIHTKPAFILNAVYLGFFMFYNMISSIWYSHIFSLLHCWEWFANNDLELWHLIAYKSFQTMDQVMYLQT